MRTSDLIPVFVQRPNEPKTKRLVGEASTELTAAEVADQVGVPDGCLLDGKIMRRKGERHWSLVALVRFAKGGGDDEAVD